MNKQILRLAFPNILSNISIPLLGIVDTAVVGHLDDVYYLGAIAIGGMIFNFIYWGFGFLRMGNTGLSAQAYGREDQEECALILTRSLVLSLVISFFLICSQDLILKMAFALVDTSENVERYARSYFLIRIYAAPASLCLYAFQGWFLGLQNSYYPLYLALLANVLNIGLNFLFVMGFSWQSDGVAYATVVAQYSALLLAFFLVQKKYGSYILLVKWKKVFEPSALWQFFTLNRDIFLRTLCLIFTYSYFTAQSSKGGEEVLAAHTILLQLWTFFAYGADGFAFAAESLTGKFLGQKDFFALKKAVRYCFLWVLVLGTVFTVFYALADQQILTLFTDQKIVLQTAQKYYIWSIFAPLISGVCFIWDGVFVGVTASRQMRDSMLLSTFAIFLPAYHLTKDLWGFHALWFAMTLYMLTRALTLFLAWRKLEKTLV